MINVAVIGCTGRMGKETIKIINKQKNMQTVMAVKHSNDELIGMDVGEYIGIGTINVKISCLDDLKDELQIIKPDVVVEFTNAGAATKIVESCSENNTDIIIGSTGFSSKQNDMITSSINNSNIKAVISPNMATGINVFFKIAGLTAKLLGDSFDVEVIEAHHHNKLDAPSGTADETLNILEDNLELNNSDVVYGRSGMVGKRAVNEIGVHSIRAGDIVGNHTVLYAGDGERIEITHRMQNRQPLAIGVIKAINYNQHVQEKKIANMFDVLNL